MIIRLIVINYSSVLCDGLKFNIFSYRFDRMRMKFVKMRKCMITLSMYFEK